MVDPYGRRRKHSKVICDYCGEEFWKPSRFVGKRNYCCKHCADLASRKGRLKLICAYCGKEFTRCPSKVKSGNRNFCSRRCKNLAQRTETANPETRPSHYKNGECAYREIAFRNLGKRCSVCGYDIEDVLEVHHKNGDRSDNRVENLDVLCPTHHVEYQIGLRHYA